MKPQLKDLKTIVEKLEKSARQIRWSQPRRPDALLIGARIFLPPDVISLITADFLSITSAEVFKHRVRCWEYADDYGLALWNVVKVLVDDLRKELLTRHDDALEKQHGARLHKSLVVAGIDHITRVRLILPREPGTQAAAVEHTDNGAAGAAPEHGNDLTTVVAQVDFYAGSPKKSLTEGRKRKAQESADTAESSKRRKKAVSASMIKAVCKRLCPESRIKKILVQRGSGPKPFCANQSRLLKRRIHNSLYILYVYSSSELELSSDESSLPQ
jgi:hypothetical protein